MVTSGLHKCFQLLSFSYPLLVFLLKHQQQYLLALAVVLLVLMLNDLRQRVTPRWFYLALLVTVPSVIAIASFNQDRALRLYPFLMSLSVLNLFASAKTPEENPMLGPMRARASSCDAQLLALLQRAKGYWIWGLTLNSAVLGVFLFAFDLHAWALYANFYSYLYLLFLFCMTLVYVAWQRRRSV